VPDSSGWNERARAWARHWPPLSRPARDAVLAALALEPGDRLLDAGCGSGDFLAQAAARGAHVSGVDVSAGMLAIAHERVPDADLREGDIACLPWEDGAFDAVTAFNAVQFTADLAATIAELARVGHRVAICNWTEPSELPPLFTALSGGDVSPARRDVREPGVLESLLTSAGLSVIKAAEVDTPYEAPDLDSLVAALRDGSGLTGDVESLAAPNRRADGSYRFENRFRYVLATRS
jgi:SAM-dependent methyltransferase